MKVLNQDYDYINLILILLMVSTYCEESLTCPKGFHITYDDIRKTYICYPLLDEEGAFLPIGKVIEDLTSGSNKMLDLTREECFNCDPSMLASEFEGSGTGAPPFIEASPTRTFLSLENNARIQESTTPTTNEIITTSMLFTNHLRTDLPWETTQEPDSTTVLDPILPTVSTEETTSTQMTTSYTTIIPTSITEETTATQMTTSYTTIIPTSITEETTATQMTTSYTTIIPTVSTEDTTSTQMTTSYTTIIPTSITEETTSTQTTNFITTTTPHAITTTEAITPTPDPNLTTSIDNDLSTYDVTDSLITETTPTTTIIGPTTTTILTTDDIIISTTPTNSDDTTTESITTDSTTTNSTEYLTTDLTITDSTESTTTDVSAVTITTESVTESTPIAQTPEELIEQILEDLQDLLEIGAGDIFIPDIMNTFDQINTLLDHSEDVVFPGELLQSLEEVALRVNLSGEPTEVVVRENIALLMADVSPENPVLGMSVATRDTEEFTDNSFDFLTEWVDQVVADTTEAAVFLPPSLTTTNRRIGFVVYRDDRAFNDPEGVISINSQVISVNVEYFNDLERREVVDIHINPRILDPGRNISRGCGYWEFLQDGQGYWSQDGCTFIRSTVPETLDICRCNHLTHFAEILIPRPVFSQLNEDILEVISVLGCSISILGLLAIILTSLLFTSWIREFRNQMWLQLCISLFVMKICFIIVVFAEFDYYDVSCMLTGIALHYSLLASFFWMLVVAIKSYKDLVLIFSRQIAHKLSIASSFSWGLPVVIVGLLLSIAPQSYVTRFSESNPSGSFCYPSGLGLWLSVYAPISIVLLANCVLFFLIVRSIGVVPRNLRYQRAGDKREALYCARISLVLVFFFGLPWFLGLVAFNIVAAYLFTLTATLQGFVLFIFIVLGNSETRNLWLVKLRPTNGTSNGNSGRSVTMLY